MKKLCLNYCLYKLMWQWRAVKHKESALRQSSFHFCVCQVRVGVHVCEHKYSLFDINFLNMSENSMSELSVPLLP